MKLRCSKKIVGSSTGVLVGCAVVVIGCRVLASRWPWEYVAAGSEVASRATALKTPRQLMREGRESTWVVEHDFGLVESQKTITHTIEIENRDKRELTVARVVSTCSCAGSRLEKNTAKPGEAFKLVVTYHPTGKDRFEMQKLILHFAEPDTEPAVLELKAHIRTDLYLSERTVAFQNVGLGQRHPIERAIEIRNYSDHNWAGLDLKPNVSWLGIDCQQLDVRSVLQDRPREAWKVTLRLNVDASGLGSGRHTGFVEIKPNSLPLPAFELPVSVLVSSPVQVMPSQVFLSRVEKEKPIAYKILMRFTPDVFPNDASEIALSHDLGIEADLKCQRVDASFYVVFLTTQIPASYAKEALEGKILVAFHNQSLPPLQIPVYMKVSMQ